MTKRSVLIHAVTTAIPPILQAFREGWPEAEVSNLLDDDLMPAYRRDGGLSVGIARRIRELALYAARTGADGILFTCSVFTAVEDLAKRLVSIPLLKPDEAMVAAALDSGKRIGVVATNPPAAPAAEAQLKSAASARGMEIEVVSALADGAIAAMNAGDPATRDRLIAEAAANLSPAVEVICLAQVSMALARAEVQARVHVPVLTSPATAVARLKAIPTGAAGK